MPLAPSTTQLLAEFQAGNDSARAALLEHTLERLRVLAARMFHQYAHLRSMNDTDEVMQQALVRLHRALATVRLTTARDYFGLAARQIRWVLQDLARKAAACAVTCTNQHEDLERLDTAGEPSTLAEWTEFHERISALPDDDRELFDLLLYQGVMQAEAAEILNLPLRTLKRRWQQAKIRLHDALRGDWPSLEANRP
jgi:RNA polymerase sigma-70 factor (ECF subfamily)